MRSKTSRHDSMGSQRGQDLWARADASETGTAGRDSPRVVPEMAGRANRPGRSCFGRFFNIDSDFDFWDITGSTFTYNEHHELTAKPGSTIRIFNLYGAVNVTPSDTDTIVVDVEKTKERLKAKAARRDARKA